MQQWQNSIHFSTKNKKAQSPERGQAILVFWLSELMWGLLEAGWRVTKHYRFTHSENRIGVYMVKEDAVDI